MENELLAGIKAIEQTFSYLWHEVSQVEGNDLRELWLSVTQQINTEQSSRVLWILIAVLSFSGTMFVVSTGLLIVEFARSHKRSLPAKSAPQPHQTLNGTENKDRTLTKIKIWVDQPVPHHLIKKLQTGDIDGAEKVLIMERQKQPKSVELIIYLLACRATRNDSKQYQKLVNEIFPDGLKPDEEVSRHAVEIGRLIQTDLYPEGDIPCPETIFDIDFSRLGDALDQISEYDSVKTLLDLVRISFEVGNTDAAIRHLLVEIIVCGDSGERKLALDYCRRMNRKNHA